MAGSPTGTVTFLFTDLVRSTRLWEEQPEAMRDALARHDQLLRDTVEASGGHVVKTTGDGLHAAFATAEDALAGAAAAQQTLRKEDWHRPDLVSVRMGLHTGSAELRDGDYFGSAVNRAARLMSAAHGGQILVSHVTEELVRDSLPLTLGLLDLGEHRLRDLSRPVHVFQLVGSSLRDEFPPIDSLDAFPGNLPVQHTSFVGRQDELRQLAQVMDGARLVTLTGPGGVGKSRLALHVAADLLPRFRHGAWICELAAIDDERSMIDLVTNALRVEPREGVTIGVRLLEFLGDRELLLILDNCEHVLDAAATLATDVLSACPRVGILTTSREPLGVEGEQVWPVEPLAVSGTDDAGDAVRLFRDRARAVNPRLPTDPGTEAGIAEICRRLDGIPLAIELAAARVVSMNPHDIAARLDERFRLLSGKRRGDSERHQTLEATIDWSFRLLGPTEQRVFERLSVLAGTFDSATAEAVAGGDGIDEWDVVDALSGLVAKSMVAADHIRVGETRYELLETLRAYGRLRLDAQEDADRWLRQATQHYVGFVEHPSFQLRGVAESYWAERLLLELDNLRVCLAWSLARPHPADIELGMRIIASLARLGTFGYGYAAAELGAWAERASAFTAVVDHRSASMVLATAAWNAIRQGNAAAGREFAEGAMREADSALAGSSGAQRMAEAPFTALSMVEAVSGNPEVALDIAQNGRHRLEQAGADQGAILTLHSVAAAWAAACGHPETARAEAEQAVAMARIFGSPSLLSTTLFTLGIALEFNDLPGAIAALEESVELSRARTTDMIRGRTLATLADVRIRADDTRGALLALREAIEVVREGQRSELAAAIDRGISIVFRAGASHAAAVLAGIATRGPLAEVNTGSPVAARREARLREAVGDDAFEEGAKLGAVMSEEEVVDYAIRAIDTCLAQLDT
jgi:predicted ATPase/class 3 adenylate cyclase